MDHLLADLFAMDMSPLEKILRTIGVYLAMLVVIRIFGKRLMAQMNSLDLVVVLLLSNVVQNAVIGDDNTLIGGILGAVVLVLANWGLDVLSWKVPAIGRVLSGRPTPVVTDGQADHDALVRLSITAAELDGVLHQQGADSISEVRSAEILPGGSLRVELEPGEQNLSRSEFAGALAQLQAHLDARLDAIAAAPGAGHAAPEPGAR